MPHVAQGLHTCFIRLAQQDYLVLLWRLLLLLLVVVVVVVCRWLLRAGDTAAAVWCWPAAGQL
jgi:hypothetical protein